VRLRGSTIIGTETFAETPAGEQTFLLCRTRGRKEKEKAIRNRFSTSLE
jgi:hypothetical protein